MTKTSKNTVAQGFEGLRLKGVGAYLASVAPLACVGAYWAGGESALVGSALVLAGIGLCSLAPRSKPASAPAAPTKEIRSRGAFVDAAEAVAERAALAGRNSTAVIIELDEYDELVARHGFAAAEAAANRIADRFFTGVREHDSICRLGERRFGVILEPQPQIDVEACIQLAGRMQNLVEQAITIDGASVYMTATIGFAMLSRVEAKGGAAWVNAVESALEEAKNRGPGTIRAYSTAMKQTADKRYGLRDQIQAALENGEIQPWFQPQLSTDTGAVSGFEALARWNHPTRGFISPAEFLPLVAEAGLMERLGEVILYDALTAIKAWDAAGVHVPQVSVNFSCPELNDPRLAEKVRWELDRFDVPANRLCVEILESVVSNSPKDVVARNVAALQSLGCDIDLDDFGTGNASIAAIRRFNVSRIKIDRSYVMKVDRDEAQQQMVAAILTMSERLDIRTVAEGVETVGEHAILAQLGCDFVQGFGISRPMPFDKTIEWIEQHEAKLDQTPLMPGKRASEG